MSLKFGKDGAFVIDLMDFSGGLNDRDDPREIADNETPFSKNCVSNMRGAVGKRYGYDVVSSLDAVGGVRGLLPYPMMDGTNWLLIFHGGEVYAVSPDDFEWGTSKGSYGADGGEPVGGEVFANLAIFSNGAAGGVLKKWDGSGVVESVGGSPPANTNIISKVETLLLLVRKNVVYWSAPEDPEDWTTENNSGFKAISAEDGEDAVAILEHANGIIVFKETSKKGLQTSFDETNLVIGLRQTDIVDRSDGALAGRSVVPVRGGGIFFLSEDGFKTYGVDADSPLMRTSRGLSEKTPFLISRVNRVKREKICAVAWKDQIFSALPLDFSEENNAVMVYDPIYRGWNFWEMPIAAFCIFENEIGKRELYFGHAREPKLCKMNREYTDDVGKRNEPIDMEWRSKTFSPSPSNRWGEINLWLKMTKPNTSVLSIVIDGRSRDIEITDADIVDNEDGDGTWGDTGWEDAFGGEGYDTERGQKLYTVVKKINISARMKENNQGAEFYFSIKNNNAGEGLWLRRAVVKGVVLENAF